jgi:kumamolisin
MIRRLASSALTVAALVCALNLVSFAQLQPTLTRHTRDAAMNGQARSMGRMPGNQAMELTLVLPLRNQSALRMFLQDLYTPSSPNYRHFLTVEQFTENFGPTIRDYATVQQWAKDNGFTLAGTSRNRLIVRINGSVQNVERAFHVNMMNYQHPTEGRTFFAPDREPTADLSVQLFHIGGLDSYSRPHANFVRRDPGQSGFQGDATTGSCPQKSFCGSDMRAAYYGGTTLTGAGQTLGLFEFLGTDLQDVTTYYTNAGQVNNVPITLLSVDGASTSCLARLGCDDTEQTLDITQALGMAPGLANLTVYIGKSDTFLDDAGIFNAMATAGPLDAQLSCSWSWTPPDPTTDDPFFLEFAAQGQNLFDAAGDSGKWTKQLTFVWPADDANLVSVGGTVLKTTGAGGGWLSETGWSDSGGGISPNNFAIPSYQVAAAAGCTNCSQTFRNGPDVAANSDFSFYVCADQTTCTANEFGGTSFAAPMWAGYLALANEQAVSMGQPPLGFINPAVYTIGLSSTYNDNFHDVKSGSNGWPATVGFDLNTGFGSPNGATLINSLTAPQGSFTVSASPRALQIARGGSAKTTITTTISGSFNSGIALTASVPGVTFNPSAIPAPGAGSSTMTIRIGPNVAVGVHTIKVTATGGSTTQTTKVLVNVTN